MTGVFGTARVTPVWKALPGPEPAELTARNFTVYAVPFVSPEIVNGEVVPPTDVKEPKLFEFNPILVAYS
jgi:hypothetical protein